MVFEIPVLCHLKLCAHQKTLRSDAENHPKLVKNGIPRGFKHEQQNNYHFLLEFGPELGPKRSPKWDQNWLRKTHLKKGPKKTPTTPTQGPFGRVRPGQHGNGERNLHMFVAAASECKPSEVSFWLLMLCFVFVDRSIAPQDRLERPLLSENTKADNRGTPPFPFPRLVAFSDALDKGRSKRRWRTIRSAGAFQQGSFQQMDLNLVSGSSTHNTGNTRSRRSTSRTLNSGSTSSTNKYITSSSLLVLVVPIHLGVLGVLVVLVALVLRMRLVLLAVRLVRVLQTVREVAKYDSY